MMSDLILKRFFDPQWSLKILDHIECVDFPFFHTTIIPVWYMYFIPISPNSESAPMGAVGSGDGNKFPSNLVLVGLASFREGSSSCM